MSLEPRTFNILKKESLPLSEFFYSISSSLLSLSLGSLLILSKEVKNALILWLWSNFVTSLILKNEPLFRAFQTAPLGYAPQFSQRKKEELLERSLC